LRIHPHIKRPISHHAETALRIFELSRRDAKIEKRASNGRDPKLVENFVYVPKIRPLQGHAFAEPGQLLGRVLNCIGILIQREHICASSQDCFAVAPASAGCINNQATRPRREQFHYFGREHRPVIGYILHFLRLLFENERTGGEPDGPLKQQSIHIVRD
jgi:hypothetical protein